MLLKLITLIFRSRHYWRDASFDEIAELYLSRLILLFAQNFVAMFVALYLYELGYSVINITLLYAGFYLINIVASPLAAKYIAYYGPKHGILLASILKIPSMFAILLVEQHGLVAVIGFGVFQQVAAAFYNVSYLVDFSKVRHVEHTGKELGIMQIIEKVAKALGPAAGGLLATTISPQAVIALTAAMYLLSSLPLFKTVEPTRLRAKLSIKGFPWRYTLGSLGSQIGAGFDFIASGMAWTLFIASVVFASFGEGIYALIGTVSSVAVFVSIMTSWLFGKLVDRQNGQSLYIGGILSKAVLHAIRPFVATPMHLVGVNIASEVGSSAQMLAWTRAKFDIADTSGFRIIYLTISHIVDVIGALLACLAIAGLIWLFGVSLGFQLFFVLAGFVLYSMLLGRRYIT